jgi:hypothetical protein
MQPIVVSNDVVRFKANRIVRKLLDVATRAGVYDLNHIAADREFSQDDRAQFAQLIGYSVTGYHELSHISDQHCKEATDAAQAKWPGFKACRDMGCKIHCGVELEVRGSVIEPSKMLLGECDD